MNIFINFEGHPLSFRDPKTIISCDEPVSLIPCFEAIEDALARGYYAAGFISFEAGYCFEGSLREDKKYDFPLLWMGIYEAPRKGKLFPERSPSGDGLKETRLNISKRDYFAGFQRIREAIGAGDVYQVNYCIKTLFTVQGDPRSLFAALLREQPVPYAATIEASPFTILSLSPEMFVKKAGQRLITRPMKGTWPRGRNVVQDAWARFRFKFDPKNRAENVMITDLFRNDLGRIGWKVKVPRLYEVTGYKTLYQMTSTVTCEGDAHIRLYDLFKALFPSGSVTGAPKLRSQEIIREVEKEERQVYTGAIGYIAPNKDLFFNVPIRTLLIRGGRGEMGIGGGIVWDSTPQGEWEEMLLKARFLTGYAGQQTGWADGTF